jgi:hypothetical protein
LTIKARDECGNQKKKRKKFQVKSNKRELVAINKPGKEKIKQINFFHLERCYHWVF